MTLTAGMAQQFSQPTLALTESMDASVLYGEDLAANPTACRVVDGSYVPLNGADGQNGPMHSMATGLTYRKPAGTLYRAINQQGMLDGHTIVAVPAWTKCSWVNSGLVTPQRWIMFDGKNSVDLKQVGMMDNDTVFSYEVSPGYHYIAPSIIAGRDTFSVGDANIYYKGYRYSDGRWGVMPNLSNYPVAMALDGIMPLSYIDDHMVATTYGSLSAGTHSDGYLFGTGQMKLSNNVLVTAYGLSQSYPAPAAPLLVNCFYVYCRSNNFEVLSNGVELQMEVRNDLTHEVTYRGRGVVSWVNDSFSTSDRTQTKRLYKACVDFLAVEGTGAQAVAVPMAINYPFTVTITGLDDDNVNIAFPAFNVNECDRPWYYDHPTNLMVENKANSIKDAIVFNEGDVNPYVMSLSMMARYDKIEIVTTMRQDIDPADDPSYVNLNKILFADNGQTHKSLGKGYYTLGYLPVYTSCAWKDAMGVANFNFVDDQGNVGLPEWIKDYDVKSPTHQEGNQGVVYVGEHELRFIAQPLPDGVKGRVARVYIKGLAGISDQPIYFCQGDYQQMLDDLSIGSVTVDTDRLDRPAYNLMGQRVDVRAAKGLVFRHGERMFIQ